MRLRTVRDGLCTVLGIARRGYFIPHRHAASLVPDRRPYRWIEERFEGCREGEFARALEAIAGFREELEAIGGPPPEPRWQQDWFPGLDAAVLYALVRSRRPRRVFEIGSGHSTRFLARAVRDEAIAVEITCCDPAPRADIASLPLRLLRAPVQQLAVADIPELGPGDMLLVDSSHLLFPGSDVDWVLNRLLPSLPAGVLMQFHDMFLPDPYPQDWDWRGYAEQQAIAVLLQSGRVQPLFSSHYVRTRGAGMLDALGLARFPDAFGAPESSLWLELA